MVNVDKKTFDGDTFIFDEKYFFFKRPLRDLSSYLYVL